MTKERFSKSQKKNGTEKVMDREREMGRESV